MNTRMVLSIGTLASWANISTMLCSGIVQAASTLTASASPSSNSNASSAPSSSAGGSNAAIESQVLASQEVDAVADRIASKIRDIQDIKDEAVIVIYDRSSFASLQAFEAFAANIKVMIGAYKTRLSDLQWLDERLKSLADARKANIGVAPADHFSAPFSSHLSQKLDFLSYTAL